MRPIYLGADQGEVIDSPIGGQLVFKARGAQTNGALTVFESVIPPGEGPPLHVHDGADEVIYVLEGMIRVRLDDQVKEAAAGAFVFIPRGAPHTWQSSGATPARFLVTLTPAALETFFGAAAAANDAGDRGDVFTTLGGDELRVLGPPLAETHPK